MNLIDYKSLTQKNLKSEIEGLLSEAKQLGNEGLMLKASSSPYKPSTRTLWGKVKYNKGLGIETLDLVPIAAYYGKGKRKNVFGAYLLACY